MKQVFRLNVFIIILFLFATGCFQEDAQEDAQKPPEDNSIKQEQKPDRTAIILEREIEKEQSRSRSLEQDVKNLQDDLSVTHAIAYSCVFIAALFIALLLREKHRRKALEDLIKLSSNKRGR